MSELLSRLSFAWPWVWLLLPLPFLTGLFTRKTPDAGAQVRVPFLPQLVAELQLSDPPRAPRRWQAAGFWLAWLLAVCALARPEYLLPPQQIIKPLRNVVLVLDVSGSMDTRDATGGQTRLQAVQHTVREFINRRKTDRMGLVIFANQAWPFAPLSEDKQALLERVTQLSAGMAGQQTAVGDALAVAVKLLDTGVDARASRMAILLTDGNDTASRLAPDMAVQLAVSLHVEVHTIAFGDAQATGPDKVDTALLQTIAQQTGGQFWQAGSSASRLAQVWQAIDAMTPARVETHGYAWRKALFPWPLGSALVVLLLFSLAGFAMAGRRL